MKILWALTLGLLSGSLNAQTEAFPVHLTVHNSPQEQIADGQMWAQKAYEAHDRPTRMAAVAQAAATLEVVAHRWPGTKRAIVDAAIIEADLYYVTEAPGDAEKVLIAVEPIAKNEAGDASVQLRLGRVASRLGRLSDAEVHLLAAERAARRDGPAVEFAATRELAVLSKAG